MRKRALITGITGQDGSYLAELLLEKGYEVHGMIRPKSDITRSRIDFLFDKIDRHYGDLTDTISINNLIEKIKPDEIYNLGAQSHVGISWQIPEQTREIIVGGVSRILDAVKRYCPQTKIYLASSSDMFGKALETPQTETTPFNPQSPYAEARVESFELAQKAKEKGLFVCNGICYNHESPRRGENFVTRKITKSLAEIKLGFLEKFSLGDLNAKRDWGFAGDYVEAMWMMLQQEEPDDYIIGTGKTHSVKDFVEKTAREVGIEIEWRGEGIEEKGYDQIGNSIIDINPKFYRPSEVNFLVADASKAREKLGWVPKTNFDELVKIMVKADLERLSK